MTQEGAPLTGTGNNLNGSGPRTEPEPWNRATQMAWDGHLLPSHAQLTYLEDPWARPSL